MPVVSNTSPLLNLAIINHLGLLQQQFKQILIPPAVEQELKPQSNYPGASLIHQALQTGWIVVTPLVNDSFKRILMLDLDVGESEAIALALERKSTQILLDERSGRARARAAGLQPIGILGVLLKAKREGQIISIAEVMDDLKIQAKFFISNELYERMLKDANEEKN